MRHLIGLCDDANLFTTAAADSERQSQPAIVKKDKKNVPCELHDLSWQKLFPVEIWPDLKLRQFSLI